jgi:uncharacterized membrane protein YraQ (UPF0718 family)
MSSVLQLLAAGVGNLAAYLAAHVLLCLLPAFFIAGAMSALIPKSSVARWLGRNAPVTVSYPAAAAAGSLLAVCSCTIVPLFAGIHRKGAGLGPAITFLFFAPAGNVLALSYTGTILGADFAIARFVLCLIFGIGIGLLMALLFWRDDAEHDVRTDVLFPGQAQMGRAALGLLISVVALLLVGTLKLPVLSTTFASASWPLPWAEQWQAQLTAWVPFDPHNGEEGVSLQGAFLILMLGVIAVTAFKGLEQITERADAWTWAALFAAALTLVVAAARLEPTPGAIRVEVTVRVVGVVAALFAVVQFARQLPPENARAWLWETWRFVRQIFPLLVVGVFVVGVLRQLIRPEWVEALAGTNSATANAVAVGFGVFMYFPTLVEVPIAQMFLDLGMHPGPLLAYLMADPELSLQSMLMVAVVIGRAKTAAYVGLVALFSVIAGLTYGAWVDGASIAAIAASLLGFTAVLGATVGFLNRRRQHSPAWHGRHA